jgi:2,5-diamino-6-(ribosylamino)-4(3H)-pyrimidinone 5'-phosphate reductase
MAKSRPRIILSAAITLDGKIATRTGDSKLSSKKDKIRLHKLRSKVDAILVGRNTVQCDDPRLTVRYVKGKNPIRIILDSQGSISSSSKIIKTCKKIPTIIVVSKKISKKNLSRLQKLPLEIAILGEKKIHIKKLLQYLSKQKINSVLVEGGGTVNWEFINNDLVDEAIITLTPYLVGGENATTLVQGKGFSKIASSKKLRLKRISRQGNELVLHYSKL